jgi:8-oxo-dGTP diphosphatase
MPITTVAAIIFPPEPNNAKVLLTQRNIEPFKGQWCLPGGHIDRFEPAGQAITREVKEETGLAFDARFFGYFDWNRSREKSNKPA